MDTPVRFRLLLLLMLLLPFCLITIERKRVGREILPPSQFHGTDQKTSISEQQILIYLYEVGKDDIQELKLKGHQRATCNIPGTVKR